MLDGGKRKGLVDWINTLGASDCIESLLQLSDGLHFTQIAKLIDCDQVSLDFETTQERWDFIQTFLEDQYEIPLQEMVDFQSASEGNSEFELAKVCILLLSASLVSENNEMFVQRAQKLEVQQQHEVKEMLEAMLQPNNRLQTLDPTFYALTKPLDCSPIPQMQRQPASSTPIASTPLGLHDSSWSSINQVLAAGRNTPSVFSTSGQSSNSVLARFCSPRLNLGSPMSPVQEMLHSPSMANKIMLQQKEQRIKRLQRDIQAERQSRTNVEEDLRTKEDLLYQKDDEIKQLQVQLHNSQKNVHKLQADLQADEESVVEDPDGQMQHLQVLLADLKETKDRNVHLEAENSDLYDQINKLNQQITTLESLKEDYNQKCQTVAQLESITSNLELTLRGKNNCIKEMQELNLTLQNDLAQVHEMHQQQIGDFKCRLETSLSGEIGENLNAVVEKNLKDQLGDLENQLAIKCQEIENLQQNEEEMSKKLTDMEEKCQQYSESIDIAKNELNTIREEKSTVFEELCLANENLKQKESEITVAMAKMTDIVSEKETCSQMLSQSQIELQKKVDELACVIQEKVGLSADLAEIRQSALTEANSLLDKLTESELKLGETEDTLVDVRRDLNNLEQQNAVVLEDNKAMKDKCNQIEVDIESYQNQIRILEKNLKDQVGDLENQLAVKCQEIENLQQNEEEMSKKLTDMEEKCQQYSESIDIAKNELNTIRKEKSTVFEELCLANENLKQKESEITVAIARMTDIVSEKETCSQMLSQSQIELQKKVDELACVIQEKVGLSADLAEIRQSALTEANSLLDKLTESELKLGETEDTLVDVRRDLNNLEQQNAVVLEDNKAMKDKCNQIEVDIESYQNQIRTLRTQEQALTEGLNQAHTNQTELEGRLQSSRQNEEQLVTLLNDARKEKEDIRLEIDRLQTHLTETRSKLEAEVLEVTKQKEDAILLEEENKSVKEVRNRLESDITRYLSDIETLTSQTQSLTTELNEVQADRANKQQQLVIVNQSLEDTMNTLTVQRKEKEEALSEINKLQTIVEETEAKLEADVVEVTKQNKDAILERDCLAGKLEELNNIAQQCSLLEEENKSVKEVRNRLESDITRYQSDIETLTSQTQSLTTELNEVQADRANKQQQLVIINQSLEDTMNTLTVQRKEKEEALSEINKLQTILEDTEAKLEADVVEVTKQKEDAILERDCLAWKLEELKNIAQQCSLLEEENKSVKEIRNRLESDITRYQSDIETLTSQTQSLTTMLNDVQADRAEQQQQLVIVNQSLEDTMNTLTVQTKQKEEALSEINKLQAILEDTEAKLEAGVVEVTKQKDDAILERDCLAGKLEELKNIAQQCSLLEEENKSVKEVRNRLESDITRYQSDIETLTSQTQSLTTELNEVQADRANKQQQLVIVNQSLEDTMNTLTLQTKQKEEALSEINKLQTILEDTEAKLEANVFEVTKEMRAVILERDGLAATLEELKNIGQECSLLKEENKSVKEVRNRLESDITRYQSDIETLTSQTQSLTTELNEVQADRVEQQQQLVIVNQSLEDTMNTLTVQSKEKEEALSEINKLQAILDETESKLTAKSIELDNLQEEHMRITSELTSINQQSERYCESQEIRKLDLETVQNEKSALLEELNLANEKVGQLEADVAGVMDELTDVVDDKESCQQMLSQCQAELQKRCEELTNVVEELDNSKQLVAEQTSKLANYEEQLSEKESKLSHTVDELQYVEQRCSVLSDDFKTTRDICDQLEENMGKYQAELNSARSLEQELNKRLSEAVSQRAEQQERLVSFTQRTDDLIASLGIERQAKTDAFNEMHRLQENLEETESILCEEKERCVQWEQEAMDSKLRCEELERQLDESVGSSKQKMAQFEAQLASAQEQNLQLQKASETCQTKVNQLVIEMQAARNKSDQEKQDLQQQLRDARYKCENLEAACQGSQSKVLELETGFEKYMEKIMMLEGTMRSTHEEHYETEANYKEELIVAESREAELQAILELVTEQREKLKSDLEKEKQNSTKLAEELCSIGEQSRLAEDELKTHESKLHTLQQSLDQSQLIVSQREESFQVELQAAVDEKNEIQKQFDEAQGFIKDVKNQLEFLQTRMETMNRQLCQSEEQNASLQKEVQAMKEKETSMAKTVESSQGRCVQLEEKLAISLKEVNMWQETAESFQNRIAKLEEDLSFTTSNLASFQAEAGRTESLLDENLEQEQARINDLEISLQEMKDKILATEKELAKEKEKCESLKQIQAVTGESCKPENRDIEALGAENVRLTTQCRTLQENVDRCEQNLETASWDEQNYRQILGDSQRRCCELEAELCEVQANMASINNEMSRLNQQLDNATTDLRKARDHSARLESELKKVNQKNQRLSGELYASQQTTLAVESELRYELERVNARGAQAKEHLEQAESKCASLEGDLEAKVQNFTLLREELQNLGEKCIHLDSKLVKTEDELRAAKEELRQKDAEQTELKEVAETLKVSGSLAETKLQQQLKYLEGERHTLNNEIGSLQTKIYDLEEVIKNQSKLNSDLENDLVNWKKSSSAELEELSSNFQSQISSLEKNLEISEENSSKIIQDLKSQLTSGEEEYTTAKKEYQDSLAISNKNYSDMEKDYEGRLKQAEEQRKELEQEISNFKSVQKIHVREKRSLRESYEGKLSEVEQNFQRLLNEETRRWQHKYEASNASLLKTKDKLSEMENARKQLKDTLEKYSARYDNKNEQLSRCSEELKKVQDEAVRYQRKCQDLDIEVGSLRQQIRDDENTQKRLYSKIRSLEVQIELANQQLREKDHQRASFRRDAPTTVTKVKKETTFGAKTNLNESYIESSALSLHDLRPSTPRSPSCPDLGRIQLDSPKLCQEKRAPSTFSLASSVESSLCKTSRESLMSMGNGNDRHMRKSMMSGRVESSSIFEQPRCPSVPRGLGAMMFSEDEPDEMEWGRLTELKRRNTLCLPHMKSSYPVEMQTRNKDNMSDEGLVPGISLPLDLAGTCHMSLRSRKRSSPEIDNFDDSLDLASSGSKRKSPEKNEIGYGLSTPGVKLYRHYSPSRGLQMNEWTSESNDQLEQSLASYQRPGPPTPGVKSQNPKPAFDSESLGLFTPRKRNRSSPRKTPSSGRRSRHASKKSSKSKTPKGKKDQDSKNAQAKTAPKENVAFSIGFTPKKPKGLSRLMNSKKQEEATKAKKKPLGDNNILKKL